jgi:hypothetical protein
MVFCLESLEIPIVKTPTTLGRITSRADLRLQWGLKQSCIPHWELFNDLSHATCMQGNQVNSWLLVVGSPNVNLTLDFSFDHNLCFRCSNGQCEPILNIYIQITFQWYKKFFHPLGFGPCNRTLKFQESIWESYPQHGSSLGSVRVHSLTLFALPRACDVIPGSPSWPATLQPLALAWSWAQG